MAGASRAVLGAASVRLASVRLASGWRPSGWRPAGVGRGAARLRRVAPRCGTFFVSVAFICCYLFLSMV